MTSIDVIEWLSFKVERVLLRLFYYLQNPFVSAITKYIQRSCRIKTTLFCKFWMNSSQLLKQMSKTYFIKKPQLQKKYPFCIHTKTYACINFVYLPNLLARIDFLGIYLKVIKLLSQELLVFAFLVWGVAVLHGKLKWDSSTYRKSLKLLNQF